ncbi:MAG: class I SAM-dependent methyltransferase [Planctomycetia bacterium]|nr:class I SAM-dependent methyltransferase [Planctomycetia bacterium]
MPLLHNKTLQRFMGGTFLERWGIRVLAEIELFMLGFHKDRATMRQLTKIRRGRRSLITGNEQFIIHAIVAGMRGMEGDIAEVGVYAGSSTRTICEAMGDKRLHVCDTFAGLPKPTSEDHGVEHEGRFSCGIDSLRAYLAGFPKVEYHIGFCPDSVLYSSTKQCLEYFFPRLVPGGILLSHDYSLLAGVRQAFTEFTTGRCEQVIELPTTQGMLVRAAAECA